MEVRICWTPHHPQATPPEERRLLAAMQTPYSRFQSRDHLVPVALTAYLSNLERFRNSSGQPTRMQAFRFPFEPAPRTAILSDGFQQSKWTRAFPLGWSDSASRFNPEAIAAPLPRLKVLAERVLDRQLAIPSLDRAVIVLERLAGDWSLGRTLAARDRDLLWRAFRVPTYVQYIGLTSELLAEECEAYQGAHIVEESANFAVTSEGRLTVCPFANTGLPVMNLLTGLSAEIDRTRCGCGKSTPRLRSLRPFVPVTARHAIASA